MAADHDRLLVGGLEQKIIGFTHAELGSVLIKSWGLPESLFEAIGCYLSPELAQVHKFDAYLLNLASRLTDLSLHNSSVSDVLAEYSEEEMLILRLNVEQLTRVLQNAEEEFSQVFELIAPDKRFH